MSGDNLGSQPLITAESAVLTPEKLSSLGVLSPSMVDDACAQESKTRFLIEGLLPTESIGILAGDSAIGKSPLAYQLALSVAAGIPFLGMRTQKGRVLYIDLENSLRDSKTIRDALLIFLSLSAMAEDFLIMTEPPGNLERQIAEIRPALVVIDALRSYRPDVTEKNAKAGEWLKEIRRLARKYGCTILFVHHLRKPNQGSGVPDLENCNVVTWLLETEGPRAFVNQTDVRIAVAEGDLNPAALKMKWSRRVHGDWPLFLLERIFDEDNEPAGYKQLTGAGWLSPERRAAFEKLPAEFSFKDASEALDRTDDPTNKFLKECIHLGLVEKIRRGRYRKVLPTTGPISRDPRPVSTQVEVAAR